MIAVILAGEPGAGKGKQMELLPEIPFMRGFQCPKPMGVSLAAAVRRGDPSAEEIREAQRNCVLVSDKTATRIFMEDLESTGMDSRPRFVSDGFPRTLGQYEALKKYLFDRDYEQLVVIELTLLTGEPNNDKEAKVTLTARAWKRYQELQHLSPDDPRRRQEKPVKNIEEMGEVVETRVAEYLKKTQPFLKQACRDACGVFQGRVYHVVVYGHGTETRVHVDIVTKLSGVFGKRKKELAYS